MTNPPPQAIIESKPQRSWAQLVPLFVLGALLWFLYRGMQERGIPVTIQFKAGQGLQPGDSVRYLGIDIGTIQDVALHPSGDRVVVHAELKKSARDLARTGTRFWVVRPRVGFGGLAGLDTLVGSRYIDTLPGPVETRHTETFTGLEEPPIQVPEGALELTLVANHIGGLTPGAPVLWKRIEVGRILSVGLSSDSRAIHGRIAIDPQYTALLLETSRFYLSTGLNLDVGLSGMRLEIDSLKALLIGGVAFATPEEPASPARMGQHFALADKPKDEWLTWQPSLLIGQASDALSMDRPKPTKALLSYKSGLIGRTRKQDGWTLWTDRGLLGQAIVLNVDAEHLESASLEVSGGAYIPNVSSIEEGLTLLKGIAPPDNSSAIWKAAQCRNLTEPEYCLIFGDTNVTALAIDASAIDQDTWKLNETVPINSDWQGAAVIARTDGALVGLLLFNDEGVRIAPLPTELFE